MKFKTSMAVPKQQGTSLMCDSFIRTRRLNRTQSFLLEERLKALDCKKSQKNAEFDEEKHSLRKQIEEIQTVRKNWGISVERRKLLRSQGFTIDARAAHRSEDFVAIKKYSMLERSRLDSPRPQRTSNILTSDVIMKGLSQLNVQETGEIEKEIANESPKDLTRGVARSRARHQFRVIEPPCRPGSRRNFVQISSDKLNEFKEKEDEKSGETLFDPSLKLDHRGVILSPRLAKTLRHHSQSVAHQGEESLIMQPSESCERFIPGKQICQDKQTEDAVYKLRPSSAEVFPCLEKQICAKNRDLEDKIRPGDREESRKLISKSCESLDHMTEEHAPDSTPDCRHSVSRDVIRSGSPSTDHSCSTPGTRAVRTVHSAQEPRRKHATFGSRSPVRLAFVEPQNGTLNVNHDNHALDKQSFAVIESRQPRLQHERGATIELSDSHIENIHAVREKSPQLQKKVGPMRRVTLPPGFFNAARQDLVKSHGEISDKEAKRLSVASYSPNVRKSKTAAFSSQSERGRSDNVVTYAYDARPGRSLCKGYVTMQMTVKGKQVKVHIPKFPHDSGESQPVIERARKKVADDKLQSKTPQEKGQTTEEEQLDD